MHQVCGALDMGFLQGDGFRQADMIWVNWRSPVLGYGI
jgi:hypothetical protein